MPKSSIPRASAKTIALTAFHVKRSAIAVRNKTVAKKDGVEHIGIALLFGCLALIEGIFCLSIELIGLFLQAELVLWHEERSWRRIRVVERVECQPGLECWFELRPEALFIESCQCRIALRIRIDPIVDGGDIVEPYLSGHCRVAG